MCKSETKFNNPFVVIVKMVKQWKLFLWNHNSCFSRSFFYKKQCTITLFMIYWRAVVSFYKCVYNSILLNNNFIVIEKFGGIFIAIHLVLHFCRLWLFEEVLLNLFLFLLTFPHECRHLKRKKCHKSDQ